MQSLLLTGFSRPSTMDPITLAMGGATGEVLSFSSSKQKTAYEIRPRDWSSDVCSSDLAVRVDGAAVLLDLTNKTDEVLQVDWSAISLAHPDGYHAALRPDVDLGWIPPGATTAARLLPIVVPRDSSRALTSQHREFALEVPVTIRREPKRYHFTLVASVRKL